MNRRRDKSTFKQKPRTPYVTFQPKSHAGVQRGINILANAVRPTLGPVPRIVAVEPVVPSGAKLPELLDNAGLVARRFLSLPDRDADVGAMFLRHVLWRQHERVGDGTATTAVLFQSIYNQGLKYLASGGSAMRLRRFMEQALAVILDEHQQQTIALHGREQIAQIARALCYDDQMADLLGEIFDIVGEHGAVEVRSGRTQAMERQYVTGSYYSGKLFSEHMVSDAIRMRAELEEPAILVTDLPINDASDLVPLLHLIDAEGIDSLMILAKEVSDQAIATMLAAARAPRPRKIIAVKAPDATNGQTAMLDDIAVLTGARPFLRAAQDSLRKVRAEDLGRARRAWGDNEFFGFISPKGSPRAVRTLVGTLRAAFAHADDPEVRNKLRERLGKLLGGTAVLWVGGFSGDDIKARKETAERTIAAVRAAIGTGIVLGGGVSLLQCRATLDRMAKETADIDERMAYTILSRALEEPARVIVRNAGYDDAECLDDVRRAGPGFGFDVHAGRVVEMNAAGIVDAAGVMYMAIREAVSSAALALTVDVVVHTRMPELSFEP